MRRPWRCSDRWRIIGAATIEGAAIAEMLRSSVQRPLRTTSAATFEAAAIIGAPTMEVAAALDAVIVDAAIIGAPLIEDGMQRPLRCGVPHHSLGTQRATAIIEYATTFEDAASFIVHRGR